MATVVPNKSAFCTSVKWATAVSLSVCIASVALADERRTELASSARSILKTHCYRCHGVEKEVPGLDVLSHASLTRSRSDEQSFVVAGSAADSLLWQRMGVDLDMPPESSKKRPTQKERDTIREWIEAGAPEASEQRREFVSEADVLAMILSDLQSLPAADRRHVRYFSLHTSHNNPRFDNADLRMHRAALSKLVNSLSRSSSLSLPVAIGRESLNGFGAGMVYRIDLRNYGWTLAQWQTAVNGYPYGLAYNNSKLQDLASDIETLFGAVSSDGIPYLRLDWFVATAAFPSVYHQLVGTPGTASELEASLGVDVERDFVQDRLQRAGFASSGVSRHNRLIDRHVGGQTSYYYKSYDFSKSFGRSLLARFPLGPAFAGNEFADDFAFDHDGGEIIYSMPNGMQGYMLVDRAGNRIDKGPIEIVRDLRETAGTPEIINGISCIGCHRNGLLEFTNAIDRDLTLTGAERSKVGRLYLGKEEMDRLVAKDSQRFMNALQKVMGPFLQVDEDLDKPLRSFAEPVRLVAGWYNRDMGLADATAEMGREDPEAFAAIIRSSDNLLKMGLGPLAIGQTIPRRLWDTLEESSASVFQRAAVATRLGSGISLSN